MAPPNRTRAYSTPPGLLLVVAVLAFAGILPTLDLQAQPCISEFLAINNDVLEDENGEFSDWIEIHNPDVSAVNLDGYYLSDNDGNLTKWRFPAVTLPAGAYLVVFASGKDRAVPGSELHTNFKMAGGGEYLALIGPDGATVLGAFAPRFPQQFSGVSYGFGTSAGVITTETMIELGHSARYHVPIGGEPAGGDWRLSVFDDSSWAEAASGFGFGYANQLVGAGGDLSAVMHNINAGIFHGGIYLRLPFEIENPAEVVEMTLRMKYDDGFVAYLNGQRIAAANAPAAPDFNSTATGSTEVGGNDPFQSYTLAFAGHLAGGTNILAIHGLNATHGGSDFLIIPELDVRLQDLSGGLTAGYFEPPTPGSPNGPAVPGFIKDTQFNIDRGFFEAPFALEITTETPGVDIRYTTDGTLPTESHGSLYSGPVTIDRTTVLRAAAFGAGLRPSNVDTQTYLFIGDILTQPNTGGIYWDTEMDPNVVNSPGTFTVAEALAAIPSLSIVMDPDDLFGSTEGIYTHATQRAADDSRWEKPCSAEYFYHPGYDGLYRVGNGFQIECGVAINGNFSRLSHNPKHSFRLFFKEMYGPTKLEFPVFPTSPVDEFDTLLIRTGHNQGWATNHASTQMMRNQWARDIQRYDPTHVIADGNHIHLYLNGQYWGLYNFHERPDDSFGAEHYGGPKEEYDGFKGLRAGGSSQARTFAGNRTAWSTMFSLADQDMLVGDNYLAVLDYVDVDQLIDYMITVLHTGDRDGPTGIYPPAELPKNFYAFRRRHEDGRFRFFRWDSEFIFEGTTTDMSERGGTENPAGLHKRLRRSPEYRLRFADRVHRHYFNGGPYSVAVQQAHYLARSEEISVAMVAESARWGDSKREPPFTRDGNWVPERNRIVNNWMPGRHGPILDQYRADDLYPDVEAPVFRINGSAQHGGPVPANASLEISAPQGVIYYTTDGKDPRVPHSVVEFTNHTLIDEFASKHAIMPVDGMDDVFWTDPGFDDSAWPLGTLGAGYERGSGYESLIDANFDYAAQEDVMVDEAIYMRVEFDVADPSLYNTLTLLARYDDGFVAYLNGTEISRENSISPVDAPVNFNEGASATHQDSLAVQFQPFQIDQHLNLLQAGNNVLAIAGLNNGTASSDFLLWPMLEAKEITGGAIGNVASASAVQYLGPETLSASGPVKARVLSNGSWSALSEATFLVYSEPAASGNLVVSEFDYRPSAPSPEEDADDYDQRKDFEFVELLNTGSRTVDLAGVRFIAGIAFDFDRSSNLKHLEPGQRLLVVKNRAAFRFRYPEIDPSLIAGEYGLQLSDDGEEVVLGDASGADIVRFTYNDRAPWPRSADGGGNTLVLRRPQSGSDPFDPANWRPGSASPGSDGGATLASWLVTNGISDPDGDPDGNGITHWMAYTFGEDAAPRPGIETIEVGGVINEYLTLTYRQNSAAEDAEILPQVSPDLQTWIAATAVVSRSWEADGIELITVRDALPISGNESRFFRVRITVQD